VKSKGEQSFESLAVRPAKAGSCNMGSKKHMDCTVIGDGVNLAARLELGCKAFGAKILISEFTYRLLRGAYFAREIVCVTLKGKTEPGRRRFRVLPTRWNFTRVVSDPNSI